MALKRSQLRTGRSEDALEARGLYLSHWFSNSWPRESPASPSLHHPKSEAVPASHLLHSWVLYQGSPVNLSKRCLLRTSFCLLKAGFHSVVRLASNSGRCSCFSLPNTGDYKHVHRKSGVSPNPPSALAEGVLSVIHVPQRGTGSSQRSGGLRKSHSCFLIKASFAQHTLRDASPHQGIASLT